MCDDCARPHFQARSDSAIFPRAGEGSNPEFQIKVISDYCCPDCVINWDYDTQTSNLFRFAHAYKLSLNPTELALSAIDVGYKDSTGKAFETSCSKCEVFAGVDVELYVETGQYNPVDYAYASGDAYLSPYYDADLTIDQHSGWSKSRTLLARTPIFSASAYFAGVWVEIYADVDMKADIEVAMQGTASLKMETNRRVEATFWAEYENGAFSGDFGLDRQDGARNDKITPNIDISASATFSIDVTPTFYVGVRGSSLGVDAQLEARAGYTFGLHGELAFSSSRSLAPVSTSGNMFGGSSACGSNHGARASLAVSGGSPKLSMHLDVEGVCARQLRASTTRYAPCCSSCVVVCMLYSVGRC